MQDSTNQLRASTEISIKTLNLDLAFREEIITHMLQQLPQQPLNLEEIFGRNTSLHMQRYKK